MLSKSTSLGCRCAKTSYFRVKAVHRDQHAAFEMSLQMPTILPLSAKAGYFLFPSSRFFVCSSCHYKQARAISNGSAPLGTRANRKARGTALHIRTASTIASVTAVNVKRDIPLKFRSLHESLKALESEAPVYINSSQLRLALRGLESENAVTRIAGRFLPYDNNRRTESLILE